jgi:WD40 repeat protein
MLSPIQVQIHKAYRILLLLGVIAVLITGMSTARRSVTKASYNPVSGTMQQYEVAVCQRSHCWLGLPDPAGKWVPTVSITPQGLVLSLTDVEHRSEVSKLLLPGAWPQTRPSFEWSHDGAFLAVVGSDGRAALIACCIDGKPRVSVTIDRAVVGVVTDVAWSPAGRRLAISSLALPDVLSDQEGSVTIVDSIGVEQVATLLSWNGFSGLSWHPTGTVLATTAMRFEEQGIEMEPFLLDVETGEWNPALVSAGTLQYYAPVFSPAGDSLAFLAHEPRTGLVGVGFAAVAESTPVGIVGSFTATGFDAFALIGHTPSAHGPYWSPDSRWVALASEEGVWVYDTATTSVIKVGKILDSIAAFRSGSWAPDGSAFAWAGLRAVFLWSTDRGLELAAELPVRSVSWGSDKSLFTLGVGFDEAKTQRVWRISTSGLGLDREE